MKSRNRYDIPAPVELKIRDSEIILDGIELNR